MFLNIETKRSVSDLRKAKPFRVKTRFLDTIYYRIKIMMLLLKASKFSIFTGKIFVFPYGKNVMDQQLKPELDQPRVFSRPQNYKNPEHTTIISPHLLTLSRLRHG